jgi:hypothetical protein
MSGRLLGQCQAGEDQDPGQDREQDGERRQATGTSAARRSAARAQCFGHHDPPWK